MSVLERNIAKTFREEELVDFKDANEALLYAVLHNKLDLLTLLLNDENVDPTAKIGVFEDDVTMEAMRVGNTEAVKLLLKDRRVSNTINKQYLLSTAIWKQNMEIIKILLSSNYKFDYIRALCDTIEYDNLDAFKLILNDYPIDNNKIHTSYIYSIISNEQYEMFELLINNNQNFSQEHLNNIFWYCLNMNLTKMINILSEADLIDKEYISKYANDLIKAPIRYRNAEVIQKIFNPNDMTLNLDPHSSFWARDILNTAQNTEK